MNEKITHIEAALFKREIESLNKEIGRGLAIIREAINKYADPRNSHNGDMRIPDIEGLNEYLKSCLLVSAYYYGGDWLAEGDVRLHDNFEKVPEFLRSLILKRATDEFLENVSQVEEIRSIAESAYQSAQE